MLMLINLDNKSQEERSSRLSSSYRIFLDLWLELAKSLQMSILSQSSLQLCIHFSCSVVSDSL